MKPMLKNYGAAIIWIATAIAMMATAYLLKGTEYENIWLFLLGVGAVLAAAFEMFVKGRDKGKR
jgi:hypothetical protein